MSRKYLGLPVMGLDLTRKGDHSLAVADDRMAVAGDRMAVADHHTAVADDLTAVAGDHSMVSISYRTSFNRNAV